MIHAQADYFLVPLMDRKYGVGQIFETGDTPQDPPFCGLSNRTAQPGEPIRPLVPADIIAFVRLQPALIADGTWPLAGFDQIPDYSFFYDYDAQKAQHFPDTPVHDAAVIEAFMNAWHGHYPWDAFGTLFEEMKRPFATRA